MDDSSADELTEYQLTCLMDFLGFLDGRLGGHRVVFHFLNEWRSRWMPGERIQILNLHCGRGDLARAVAEWARSKKLDVQIFAVDPREALIQMARERHGKCREISFDVRAFTHADFLQAQQCDYVVSSGPLHHLTADQIPAFLKSVNLLSKRGFIVSDWLRDLRGYLWVAFFSHMWGDPAIRERALGTIQAGFTLGEAKRLLKQADLGFANVETFFGYRFSIAGERRLVMSPKLSPLPRLAGI
ncbi:MAG: methyltransferase domain-containing protein [Elusimicrobia bacterium]|nr:methyltransferase domain-containing protein [Candidatus Obscuribacterium magneticum]